MDLNSTLFDNIKIEADSDCAFFGLTAINDDISNASNFVGTFSNCTNNKLNTLLSSVSPYTISSPHGVNSSNPSPETSASRASSESSMEDSLGDALFSSDITEQLELDLPEFSCDFDILEDDDLANALLRDDSDSKDSGTSSTPDVYLGSPSAMDTPPLTPPSPVIKVETEIKPAVGSIHSSVLPMLHNLPNGANLTKILPSLKSSRGRSASHDSPDVQALKRHIRMIRNRESASLSRKKKKEYVTTLEQRLKEVETENSQLKQENQLLKTRLIMQQQQINNSQNHASSKTNGIPLPHSLGRTGPAGNKTKLIAKVALLGVCCFMILSAHAPVYRNHQPEAISNSSAHSKVLQNFARQSDFPNHLSEFPTNHLRISRSLTWQDDFKETRHENLDIPNKRARQVNNATVESTNQENFGNRTRTTSPSSARFGSTHSRHRPIKHSFDNVSIPISNIAEMTDLPPNNCKLSFNKTESLRVQNDLKGLFSRGKPKKKAPTRPFFYSVVETNNVENNKGLTVYDQRMQRYSSFLEKIQLREDTFYVVSLAMDDQLLLSAKSSNASSRPKMSFLMPWRNDSLGGKEEVMQIDCEVTKVMHLHNVRKGSKL